MANYQKVMVTNNLALYRVIQRIGNVTRNHGRDDQATEPVDEAQLSNWIKQAAKLPGDPLFQ